MIEFLQQSIDIQTDSALCLDEEVQTFGLIELHEQDMQTDERPTKNQKIQTPLPVLVDAEAQSEEVWIRKNYQKIKFYIHCLGEQRFGEDPWLTVEGGQTTAPASLQPVEVTWHQGPNHVGMARI